MRQQTCDKENRPTSIGQHTVFNNGPVSVQYILTKIALHLKKVNIFHKENDWPSTAKDKVFKY